MDDLDLDIDNYSLKDILNLFGLKSDLKRTVETLLKE